MNNLGPYQLFTIAAKEAGGVGNYMKDIERGAVSEATPGLLIKGVGMGVVLTTGVIACKNSWTNERRTVKQPRKQKASGHRNRR